MNQESRRASPDQDSAKLLEQPAQPAQPAQPEQPAQTLGQGGRPSCVLYMYSSFWLLGVEPRDFSLAEKERTACKAEHIHKMTMIFIQKDNPGPF